MSRYDLPFRLSHGSLGVIEELFGEQLVFEGHGLTPQDVAAAPQDKLDELVQLHEWASYWCALGSATNTWTNTYRAEISGRLIVPAVRTLNAGVSLSLYADAVLLSDPLNPRSMHTILQHASASPQFRKLVAYHVGILALIAPLVRAGKVVLVSGDLALHLANWGTPHERTPIAELSDELFVEQMQYARTTWRAIREIERKQPIRSRLLGAGIEVDASHIENIANRLFALTLADALEADLFDLVRDGKQFRLPRGDADFSMRRLTGLASLMMPGLERMPFGEVLALARGSGAAAEVRAAIGPIFDALPPGLDDQQAVDFLRAVAEEQLTPALRRLEKEAKALPGAESWVGAAVGVTVPIVELTTTGTLGPGSYAALGGAPLPMLAGWMVGRSDRQLAAETRRALATAVPGIEAKPKRRRRVFYR